MSAFSLAAVLLLVLSLAAACGDDQDEDTGATDAEVTTPQVVEVEVTEEETEAAVAEETEIGEATVDIDAVATPVGGANVEAAAGLVGCFNDNVNAEVVHDLREGETGTAEAAFEGCIEEELSPALADQAEPIIQQLTACAEQASQNLTDEDIAAIEQGDEQEISAFTNETLTCVSEELGIDLT